MRPHVPVLLSLLAAPAAAQAVTLARLADRAGAVRIFGDRPALDGDQVAFLGTDAASGVDGIYVTPADGSGGYALVVDENTFIPNVPGERFLYLDNPEIEGGVVAFTGGHQLSLPSAKDGIYLCVPGAAPTTYYDQFNTGGPNPFMPMLEPEGLVFRSVGYQSDFLTWTFPVHMPAKDALIGLPDVRVPGGGRVAKLTEVGDLPAFGGGEVAFSAVVSLPNKSGRGVYAWSLGTDDLRVVANWRTPMPGTGKRFDYFSHVDTDGDRVVFVGQHGFLGFGGHQGVYLAALGTDDQRAAGLGGAPHLTTVAAAGDPAPGSADTFGAFGRVAVEGDLLFFEGFLGSAHAPSGMGLYGYRDGALFEVVGTDDLPFGDSFMAFDMNTRCLDGDRLAFRATYTAKWATEFALFVATVQ